MNKKTNRVYKLKPSYVCHCYGKYFDDIKHFLDENYNTNFILDSRISIISPMNKGCYDNSYLVKQCGLNNIKLLQSEKVFNVSKEDWTNILKIEAIIELLEKVNTEYVLILDGKDTCVMNDLDADFINKFKQYNADIVYNASKERYPWVSLESYEFIKINHSKFINAGICIGYRDKLLDFYKECLNNINDIVLGYDKKPSEQYIIRKTATSTKIIVRCDYNFILFTSPETI